MPVVTRSKSNINSNKGSIKLIVTNPVVTNPVVTNPVVTNPVVTNPVVTNPIVSEPPVEQIYQMHKEKFCKEVKQLLDRCEAAIGMKNKMDVCYIVFKFINDKLPYLVEYKYGEWFVFCCTVYNKIIEYEIERNKGGWKCVEETNKQLIDDFVCEYKKTKEFVVPVIEKYNTTNYLCGKDSYKNYVNTAIKNINLEKTFEGRVALFGTGRPKRNIPRVDYTGMDTIEPCDEYDGITDIWEDISIHYDPDYNPEEDD